MNNFSLKSRFENLSGNSFGEAMLDNSGLLVVSSEGNHPPQDAFHITDVKQTETGSQHRTEVIFHNATLPAELDMVYDYFADSQTLELSGKMLNCGEKPIHGIRGPFSLRMEFDLNRCHGLQTAMLYGGAECSDSYPPRAYAIYTADGCRSVVGGALGGRSTETEAPYVILGNQHLEQGVFIAYEWPGRWCFNASVNQDNILQILVHVMQTELTLLPGKSLTIPKTVIAFFRGGPSAATNQMRRHIMRHVRTAPLAETSPMPVFYNHWFSGLRNEATVDVMKAEADFYAQLGVDYFIYDAGWFKDQFRKGIGNWELCDHRLFPKGLEELSDYVHGLGMKFGTWLEIEFAMRQSDWGLRHPEWFMKADGRHDLQNNKATFDDMLIRLNKPSVRNEVLKFLVSFTKKLHLDWLRWDFNNTPGPFWDQNDPVDEWGRIHVDYCCGLFQLLDDYLQACPEVHLECCAGGGYRMDLGMLRRAHSLWMNDNATAYHCVRAFERNLNRYLPGCYPSSVFICPHGLEASSHSVNADASQAWPREAIYSKFGGCLGLSEPSWNFTIQAKEELARAIANYKEIRHLLTQDYFPLAMPQSLQQPDGWEFASYDKQEGFFMLFGCRCQPQRLTLTPHGMKEGKTYQLKDMFTGKTATMTGGDTFSTQIKAGEVIFTHYRKR